MKKSHIVLAAIPIVCALGGFGTGQLLKGGDSHAQVMAHDTLPAPKNEAEAALHSLADKQSHGDTHAAPAQNPTDANPVVEHHGDEKHQDEQHSTLSFPEKMIPATLQGGLQADPSIEPALADHQPKAPVDMHRIDYAKLKEQEQIATKKAARTAALKQQADRMADLKDKPRLTKTAHPSLLPLETEANIAEGAIKLIADTDEHVVRLGRLTVPVYGAKSITYYVADFGVSVTDLDKASHYYDAQNAARVRDQIVTTMHTVAETQLMRGPEVDSAKLAERVSVDLRNQFQGIENFIFLSLYKTDVPRV